MIARKLYTFETPYITTQTLHVMLQDYKNPKDCIWRLVQSGELLRLKNGFFLIRHLIEKAPIPFEQIANLLYGPSYVSLEYALSFYGMIPEGVFGCTSMTLNPRKNFRTAIGTFSYRHLSQERYTVGVSHKENQLGGFFLATPEKALADHVFQLCQGMTREELLTDLLESKRIEEDSLKTLDKKALWHIADAYHSKIVSTLAEAISSL